MTPEESALHFESWAGAYGATANALRDVSLGKWHDEESKAFVLEEALILVKRNPEEVVRWHLTTGEWRRAQKESK